MTENVMGIELPIIGDKIYTSPNSGTNVIYEATYKDEPCYMIEHVPTHIKAFFEHDKVLYKNVVSKIKHIGALCATLIGENNEIIKLNFTGRGKKGLSLQKLVLARYKGVPVSKIRNRRTILRDKSLITYGFVDLRRCNLCAPGDFQPDKENPAFGVYENPTSPEEKCLTVTYRSGDEKHTEVYPYSKELHEMLATSNLCNISYNRKKTD